MTDRERFKLAYVTRAILSQGTLDLAEIEKQAAAEAVLTKTAFMDGFAGLGMTGAAAAIGAPLVAGPLAAYGIHKAISKPTNEIAQQLRSDETVDRYTLEAQRLQRVAERRKQQQEKQKVNPRAIF